ncbi:MAG: methyltransferase domain-containing protein [Flavobacteriaceae bacterium]|nr:methyltransferase domain-containing protein [Flavobacteriaceae bacterium]
MRLHRNLCLAVIDGLHDIFNSGYYADKVVQILLKRDKRWGSRDRGFIAETIYEIVRYKRLYAEIADVKGPFSRPDLWRILAVWVVLKGIPLPDWDYFSKVPKRRIKGRFDELSNIRKFRESVPDWLDELGSSELGEGTWTKELHALNKQADVILRVNTLKTSKEKLIDILQNEGIETSAIPGYPSALKLSKRANVFKTKAFKNGLFEVQDASSQLVAPFLEVKPGMRVVDCCAGAGGKTLHLAALMQNKGQLIAMDIHQNKLRELKLRARRNGVHNVSIRPIDSTKPIKKLYDKADAVLIDAPCSGLGVLKRNPDAKWKLDRNFLDRVRTIQKDILQRYSKMVKPGGKLVYASCSILPSENQDQVNNFLNSEPGKDFIFVKEQTILSSESGYDGFYMAQLIRKSE